MIFIKAYLALEVISIIVIILDLFMEKTFNSRDRFDMIMFGPLTLIIFTIVLLWDFIENNLEDGER